MVAEVIVLRAEVEAMIQAKGTRLGISLIPNLGKDLQLLGVG